MFMIFFFWRGGGGIIHHNKLRHKTILWVCCIFGGWDWEVEHPFQWAINRNRTLLVYFKIACFFILFFYSFLLQIHRFMWWMLQPPPQKKTCTSPLLFQCFLHIYFYTICRYSCLQIHWSKDFGAGGRVYAHFLWGGSLYRYLKDVFLEAHERACMCWDMN